MTTGALAATIAPMPTWRCPHCGTPQTETARCWVCRRSSTACGTCRHFRRSVAAQLGYCGLDRRRAPLVGDEIRACWESTPVVAIAPPVVAIGAAAGVTGTADRPGRLEFVEVGQPQGSAPGAGSAVPATDGATAPSDEPPSPLIAPTPVDPGWNLWGDLEG